MVRPLSREEMQQLDQMFGGNLSGSAGLMGGGATNGTVNTQGGKFSGETDGTGFVNADRYLAANAGKGIKLGDQITSDATGVTNTLNTNVDAIKNAAIPKFNPSDKVAKAEKIDAELGGGAPLNPQSAFDSRSKAWQDVIDEVNSGNGRYSYDSSPIDNAKTAIDKAKQGDEGKNNGADQQRSLLSDKDGGRSARSLLLKQKADKDKISGYGDGSREFDSMFLEAESPDLIKNRLDALNSAYDRAFGGSLDELIKSKKKEAADEQARSDQYYSDARIKGETGKAKAEADRKKYDQENKKQKGSGDGIPFKPDITTETRTETYDANPSPFIKDKKTANTTVTTYPDGSYDEQRPDGFVAKYDRNGNMLNEDEWKKWLQSQGAW